jgi:hypothetical protein
VIGAEDPELDSEDITEFLLGLLMLALLREHTGNLVP